MSSRSVIVTGAGGGLGAAVVAGLAGRGASVLAVDIDGDAATRATEAAAEMPGDVVDHVADASDPASVAEYVTEAERRFGRLDAVFNNAAIEGPLAAIADYDHDDFDRVLASNVRSVFLGMKHALPALRRSGGGSIVNTASTGGLMGWPELSGYVASKHAVVGLTRAVALETAGEQIRVNALAPGPMDTRMIWAIGGAMTPDRAEAQKLLEATVPVGRLGRAEEVASLATWLLLDAPEYLTGAVLPVDGAQTAG